MANLYRAFGLTISSDILFRELQAINRNEMIDVVISNEDNYNEWFEAYFKPNVFYQIMPNRIMFYVPNLAIFSIENGSFIRFAPATRASMDHIRLYLLGSCMGALLLQRKILPLHGSAIEIDGKAYAIVGDSGAGKSTLAKAFLNKGYKLLTDDVVAITFSNDDVPFVATAYPQQKLWLESLNQFQLEAKQFSSLVDREQKFAVPALEQFSQTSLPLDVIFELNISEGNVVQICEVCGIERLSMIYNQTFRNYFLEASDLLPWHFEASTKLISNVPIYRIERPRDSFTAHEMKELILSTIKEYSFMK